VTLMGGFGRGCVLWRLLLATALVFCGLSWAEAGKVPILELAELQGRIERTVADGEHGTAATLAAIEEELAAFLNERPDAVVALVGHTDAIGSLDSNVSLSLQRARSVRNRLVEAHGVQSRQVTVQGVGYLAPRATNETEPGRMLNRRVEVVLMPKQ